MYEELKNGLLFGKFIENWKGLATCNDKKYLWRVLGTDLILFPFGAYLTQLGK